MTSTFTNESAEMEKADFIMTNIVLEFDFVICASNYGAEEFSKMQFEYDSPVHGNDIALCLKERTFRKVLQTYYNLDFSSHKDNETIKVAGQATSAYGWKSKNKAGDILKPNLASEFTKVPESTSKAYPKEKRFDAIYSKILRACTVSSSTSSILGVRSRDALPFKSEIIISEDTFTQNIPSISIIIELISIFIVNNSTPPFQLQ